jgi:hypothetical protein
MKRVLPTCLLILSIISGWTFAEFKFFTPPGSFAIEISLENSPHFRLPMYRNAISSLEITGDWILGGTTAKAGKSPFLFLASLSRRQLEQAVDLNSVVPGQRAIPGGFGKGTAGIFYAGTLPDQTNGSGHVLEVKIENQKLSALDLGSPVPGEGIFAIAVDAGRSRLYGITFPSGKFFVVDLKNQRSKTFDETAPSRESKNFLYNYALEPGDYLCRRLVVDRKGRVFGSMPVNQLFRFDPAANRIEILKDELPEGWGRRAMGRADSWTLDPKGVLYGGCAEEGQLFRLDPETGRVSNLGKPVQMPSLKGMAFAADGLLYGVAGGAPGTSHLFSYDPVSGNYRDLGNPRFDMKAPGIEQGIAWRGFQIGTLAVSEDGKYVIMGEDEALSQLMVFPVQARQP